MVSFSKDLSLIGGLLGRGKDQSWQGTALAGHFLGVCPSENSPAPRAVKRGCAQTGRAERDSATRVIL